MRIIYITDQIYLHGGAEKILIQKMNYWVEFYGYEVLLITSQQCGRKPFFQLNEKVRHIDLDLNYVEGVSYFSPKNFRKIPQHAKKLKAAIREFDPDAIFVLSLGFVRYMLPFIAKGYPLYNEYHTSYYGFELSYRLRSRIGKIRNRVSKAFADLVEARYTNIVYLNQAEYDHYKKKNAVIIPNFFDVIDSPPQHAKKKQAVSLGRLCYQKGYDLLIDAWEIVDRAETGWTLQIYGNGEDRDALAEKIAVKGLSRTVFLNPATDTINEKLSESGFYVMSSRFETFPMVLLEAMSNGLPTVSFDCPTGPASMLTRNQDGLLVPEADIQALASAILGMIGDDAMRQKMGAAALENVKRFDRRTVMAQWDELIRKNAKK